MKDRHERAPLPAGSEHADALLDRRVDRALEAVPEMRVAEDFTQRVMQRVPLRRRPVASAAGVSVGRCVALGALPVLAAVMLAVAPLAHGMGNMASLAVESLLCVEFIAITLWMSAGRRQG